MACTSSQSLVVVLPRRCLKWKEFKCGAQVNNRPTALAKWQKSHKSEGGERVMVKWRLMHYYISRIQRVWDISRLACYAHTLLRRFRQRPRLLPNLILRRKPCMATRAAQHPTAVLYGETAESVADACDETKKRDDLSSVLPRPKTSSVCTAATCRRHRPVVLCYA